MKTWSVMYALIWASFAQILIIMFPVIGLPSTLDLHLVVGVAVIALALVAFRRVRETTCPDRIKRIAKTTAILGAFQAVLGALLYAALRLGAGVPFQDVVLLLHVVTALAIITQAASSATAFDMWEEKELAQASPPPG